MPVTRGHHYLPVMPWTKYIPENWSLYLHFSSFPNVGKLFLSKISTLNYWKSECCQCPWLVFARIKTKCRCYRGKLRNYKKKHFEIKLKLFFPTHRVFLIASQILGKKTNREHKENCLGFSSGFCIFQLNLTGASPFLARALNKKSKKLCFLFFLTTSISANWEKKRLHFSVNKANYSL